MRTDDNVSDRYCQCGSRCQAPSRLGNNCCDEQPAGMGAAGAATVVVRVAEAGGRRQGGPRRKGKREGSALAHPRPLADAGRLGCDVARRPPLAAGPAVPLPLASWDRFNSGSSLPHCHSFRILGFCYCCCRGPAGLRSAVFVDANRAFVPWPSGPMTVASTCDFVTLNSELHYKLDMVSFISLPKLKCKIDGYHESN